MKDFRKPSDRLRKMGHEAHFELADSDDFFGFDAGRKAEGWSMWRTLGVVLLTMLVLVASWNALGNMQQTCLDLNGGDITKCE